MREGRREEEEGRRKGHCDIDYDIAESTCSLPASRADSWALAAAQPDRCTDDDCPWNTALMDGNALQEAQRIELMLPSGF